MTLGLVGAKEVKALRAYLREWFSHVVRKNCDSSPPYTTDSKIFLDLYLSADNTHMCTSF
ncbi:hypothetical protein Plhal304r1_c039g0116171 [Plasmopara halstedii]